MLKKWRVTVTRVNIDSSEPTPAPIVVWIHDNFLSGVLQKLADISFDEFHSDLIVTKVAIEVVPQSANTTRT